MTENSCQSWWSQGWASLDQSETFPRTFQTELSSLVSFRRQCCEMGGSRPVGHFVLLLPGSQGRPVGRNTYWECESCKNSQIPDLSRSWDPVLFSSPCFSVSCSHTFLVNSLFGSKLVWVSHTCNWKKNPQTIMIFKWFNDYHSTCIFTITPSNLHLHYSP